MNKYLLGLVLVLGVGAAACGGAGDGPSSEPVPPVKIALGYVACTTVTDSVPNNDCGDGQLSVTRCTGDTESPDADHCTGPKGDEQQMEGSVWCCAPTAPATVAR